MDSTKSKITNALKSFWFFSSAIILLSLVAAIWVYRSKFGGGFSQNSSDWSDFGSYMGGVFGPLVSFVTLLAVLKTVYLQRELLDVQQEEFERMNGLQRKTFNSQKNQMKSAAKDALELKVAAAQDSAIKVIEMLISTQEKDYDRYSEMTFKFHDEFREEFILKPGESREQHLMRIVKCRDRARFAVGLLSGQAYSMAIGDFESVQDVRRSLKSEVAGVYKELDLKFPVGAEEKP